MNDETIDNELLSPPGLSDELLQLGLQKTEMTEAEFFLAEELVSKHSKPSVHDCIALAIAKVRGLILLTGGRAFKKGSGIGRSSSYGNNRSIAKFKYRAKSFHRLSAFS